MIRVVSNSKLLRKFKTIDIFVLDLGFNLKGAVNLRPGSKPDEHGKMKIRDEFIVKYNNLYGVYASKYGHIGPVTFYEDVNLPQNQLQIFKGDDIYEVEYTEEDMATPIRQYLSSLLEYIDGGEMPEEVEKNVNTKPNVIYTNMPEDVYRPDMSLPKDQYIQSIIDMRKKQAGINGLS